MLVDDVLFPRPPFGTPLVGVSFSSGIGVKRVSLVKSDKISLIPIWRLTAEAPRTRRMRQFQYLVGAINT
jgi:hypothetical protein